MKEMETKRCKKCGCIYEATEIRCPTCGKKYREKRSKMWLYPVSALAILIISGVTGGDEMLGLAGLLVIIWIMVLFYRKVLKGNVAPLMQELEKDRTPVAAKLLSYDGNSVTKAGTLRTAARGAVGGMLAGPAGFAIGVATAKRNTKTTGCSATFMVEYESGRRGTETVDVESGRFMLLYDLAERDAR